MSETEVVVLPSPAFVGVIAVVIDELAVRAVGEAVEDRQRHLGSRRAVGPSSPGSIPASAATSAIGRSVRVLGDLESGQHVRTLLGDGGVTGH